MTDIRALSNRVLDYADKIGRPITNMALNKILYFVYFHLLIEDNLKITDARIEAWDYGPVFREVYHGFKHSGSGPIRIRLNSFDMTIKRMTEAHCDLDQSLASRIKQIVDDYIFFDAMQLRDISHEMGGAWYRVWNHRGTARVRTQSAS